MPEVSYLRGAWGTRSITVAPLGYSSARTTGRRPTCRRFHTSGALGHVLHHCRAARVLVREDDRPKANLPEVSYLRGARSRLGRDRAVRVLVRQDDRPKANLPEVSYLRGAGARAP